MAPRHECGTTGRAVGAPASEGVPAAPECSLLCPGSYPRVLPEDVEVGMTAMASGAISSHDVGQARLEQLFASLDSSKDGALRAAE